MSDSQVMTIKLSPEAREFIRQRVESGEFASEDDVVTESLEVLMEQTVERERWEKENVIAAHDEWMADPSTVITFEELQLNLATERLKRLKVG